MIVLKLQQVPQSSSQMPQCHHKCLDVAFDPQNLQIRVKCDPIVDRVFFTVPEFVTYSSESTPINTNWATMTLNAESSSLINSTRQAIIIYASNRSRIHRKSNRIVPYVSKSPQTRRKSSQVALSASKSSSQQFEPVATKLMTHPLVSKRTAMP